MADLVCSRRKAVPPSVKIHAFNSVACTNNRSNSDDSSALQAERQARTDHRRDSGQGIAARNRTSGKRSASALHACRGNTLMGLFSKDIQTMDDLLLHGLKDIYYAENQIVKSLPEADRQGDQPRSQRRA